ncbi:MULTISPECIES: hypothetical protein [unclassified Cupriavidus]|uniref:hypothetical protein n=1 Tax=Cupriavidus sp. H19C3 TaxID=3241603 RepID=UPI003BF8AB71
MQIFSLFDAQMHGATASPDTTFLTPSVPPAFTSGLRIGFQLRIIPASASLGNTCDYVFLRAGETQPAFSMNSGRTEWWACLRGGLCIREAGREVALLGGGDVFEPAPGRGLELQALLESVLVRVVADLAAPCGPGECALIDVGEGDWARHQHAQSVRWAVCYRGTLKLQWRPERDDSQAHIAYMHPGTAFAPDPRDVFTLEALLPAGGLLCCVSRSNAPRDAAQG